MTGDRRPDWSPMGGVALEERPEEQTLCFWEAEFEAAKEHVPGGLYVSTQDLLEVLGPDADGLLASVDVELEQLIELLNAKTTLIPRVVVELDEPAPVKTSWKRRFVKAAVMATLLSLTGGGATALAMDKAVTVDVDGQSHTVHTYAGTVDDVLKAEGLTAGAHDALMPLSGSRIGDGGKIVLQRGRQMHLTVDGVRTDAWVKSRTVAGALREMGVSDEGVKLSASPDNQIPVDGLSVDLKTSKTINLIDGGNAPRQVVTHATTVEELLHELNIGLGGEDSVSPAQSTKLTNGAEIDVSRNGITVVNEKQAIDPPVQKVDDATMTVGTQKVDDPGTPGEKMVTYRLTMRNGRETHREQIGEPKVLTAAKPKIMRVGTKPAPPAGPVSNGAMWDRIARCEASGNWAANTGNGYYGGLQFDHGTWISNGGGAYANNANGATREQQIEIANKVYATRGLSPWGCG